MLSDGKSNLLHLHEQVSVSVEAGSLFLSRITSPKYTMLDRFSLFLVQTSNKLLFGSNFKHRLIIELVDEKQMEITAHAKRRPLKFVFYPFPASHVHFS